jgi:hypothetical protein
MPSGVIEMKSRCVMVRKTERWLSSKPAHVAHGSPSVARIRSRCASSVLAVVPASAPASMAARARVFEHPRVSARAGVRVAIVDRAGDAEEREEK